MSAEFFPEYETWGISISSKAPRASDAWRLVALPVGVGLLTTIFLVEQALEDEWMSKLS